MTNYKLIISYDGSCYFGWQKTHTGPTIEQALEQAIMRLLGCPVKLEAASRTDRGVHAKGQVVHFLTEKTLIAAKFLRGVNALLPNDISAIRVEEMPVSFHPTIDAASKEYHYFICNGPIQTPMNRHFSWHFPRPLDIEKMQKAATEFIGEHDYSSFSNAHYQNALCTLKKAAICPMNDGRIRIELRGNRFLYKMARNIVGTLVYIGCQKLPEGCIDRLISAKDRKQTGMTAPAHGLFLMEVFYH